MLPLKYVVFLAYLLMEFNSVLGDPETLGDPEIVSRAEWGARAPLFVPNITNPVPLVVIHHSAGPAACFSKEACSRAMKSMQNYHMDSRKWEDIGYSFAAGSDGRIYMGRGWSAEGAHARGYNRNSIGICFIGEWSCRALQKSKFFGRDDLEQIMVRINYPEESERTEKPDRPEKSTTYLAAIPPAVQLNAVKALIKKGVEEGYIKSDYQLLGHRSLSATLCPGDTLFREIQTWPHWVSAPTA